MGSGMRWFPPVGKPDNDTAILKRLRWDETHVRTGLAAALAVLLIPLLAGCTADDGPPASAPALGVPAAQLDAGRFYSFRHRGGALVFTLDSEGDAAFDLYDGADTRLGSVGFSSAPPRAGLHRIEGVAAGDVVIRLQTLNGTLRITSGGAGVGSFQPLAESVERVVLVARPARGDPVPIGLGLAPLPTQDPVDDTVDVAFQRAPAELRVLATGPWQNLTVEVRSGRGPVLRSEAGGSSGGIALGPVNVLAPLLGQATLQNLRDGRLMATVRADDLAGAVVLESRTYSRAALPGRSAAGPDPASLPFSYGALPDGPSAFAVHADAARLVLWQEGAAGNATEATVALFGPRDERLGTLLVPANGSVAMATVGPGDYVAVLLSGRATLGADRAPADFQLRPLDVRQTLAPATRAGGSDEYAVATEPVDATNAFALRPGTLAASGGDTFGSSGSPLGPFGGCDAGRFLVVAQDGETLVASLESLDGTAPDASPFADGTLALGDGQLTVTHDGFGDDGCPRPAVTVLSYERP